MLQNGWPEGFEALGIRSGDTLLVHSSLKSLEGASPADVIEALLALLGPEGTLMFPTLSYLHSNRNNPVFDVRRTPSNVGAIPGITSAPNIPRCAACVRPIPAPPSGCGRSISPARTIWTIRPAAPTRPFAACGTRAARCCSSAAGRVRIRRCTRSRS